MKPALRKGLSVLLLSLNYVAGADCRQNILTQDTSAVEAFLEESKQLQAIRTNQELFSQRVLETAQEYAKKIGKESQVGVFAKLYLAQFANSAAPSETDMSWICRRSMEAAQGDGNGLMFSFAYLAYAEGAPPLDWSAPTNPNEQAAEHEFQKSFDALAAAHGEPGFARWIEEGNRLNQGSFPESPPLRNPFRFTRAEHIAVQSYLGNYYQVINSELRNKTRPSTDAFILTLNSALQKLPVFKGTVYRGTRLSAEWRALHNPGNIVVYPSYTSTSTSEKIAQVFFQGDMMNIESKTGRLMLSPWAAVEQEVLFIPNTKFKISEKLEDANGNFSYRLAELLSEP